MRSLEREIANVCRKVARRVVKEGKQYSITVTPENVNEFLGVIKYREFWAEKKNEIGLTTGLAWTEVGGSGALHRSHPHAGQRTPDADRQTGRRHAGIGAGGHELRALAHRQLSACRAISTAISIFTCTCPKAPSRRTALRPESRSATSIVSALTRIPVRCDVAMTGEITLRGKVLPIGGMKEKLLAAHRVGMRTVILPKDNEKDLADIPAEIQADLSIRFVENMDEVLEIALERPLTPGNADAVPEVAAKFEAETESDQGIDATEGNLGSFRPDELR